MVQPTSIMQESSTGTDTRHLDTLLETFDLNLPGADSPLSDEEVHWVLRAEQLWQNFCNDIVWGLHFQDTSEGYTYAVQRFLYMQIPQAERILSFESVYSFYQAYISRNLEPCDGLGNFPDSYYPLSRHLDTARDVFDNGIDESGIGRWRVYQAFQNPSMRLQIQTRRMEQIHGELRERVARFRSDAGL
ncbi:MAG: hypothetical protein Q9182_002007 [Xanthomendoza sp. 2 TL-2023]